MRDGTPLISTALGVYLCNSASRLLVESDNINVFILQWKIRESEKRNESTLFALAKALGAPRVLHMKKA